MTPSFEQTIFKPFMLSQLKSSFCNDQFQMSFLILFFLFQDEFQEDAPRVLGLSASIVVSKCNIQKFIKMKQELEQVLDSTVITTENIQELLL